MKDYYYLLGVKNLATDDEIKRAYRKLAAKFHPDTNNGDPWFTDRFKEIQEAYNTLSSAESREEFDQTWQLFFNREQQDIHKKRLEELNHREEVLLFKEEVLRIKQDELEERENSLVKEKDELNKWHNKYVVTRAIAGLIQNSSNRFSHNPTQNPNGKAAPKARRSFVKIIVILIVSILSISWVGSKLSRKASTPSTFSKAIAKENFQGQVGKRDVLFQIKWLSDSAFEGSYSYVNGEESTIKLTGNKKAGGKIHLKAYKSKKLISKIILTETSLSGPSCWEGQLYEKDGSRLPVHICESPSQVR